MNERKKIKEDKIKTYFCCITLSSLLCFSIIGMFVTWEENDVLAITFLCLFFVIGIIIVCVFSKYEKRFISDANRKGSNIYTFKHLNYEQYLDKISNFAWKNNYVKEDRLITKRGEQFTVFSKEIPCYLKYPKEKICVYCHTEYEAEVGQIIDGDLSNAYPNDALKEEKYKEFYNMICGNWGRNYKYPKDWVDYETILIIIVDEWNEALNWVMNAGGNLPFVLISLFVKSDVDVMYLTKDYHKKKKENYTIKCNELFEMLDIHDKKPVKNQKYTDIRKKIMNS